jgi:hypothetical protein
MVHSLICADETQRKALEMRWKGKKSKVTLVACGGCGYLPGRQLGSPQVRDLGKAKLFANFTKVLVHFLGDLCTIAAERIRPESQV